ncbi:hypothetical protein ACOMHN_023921 [Nucella lapillus]
MELLAVNHPLCAPTTIVCFDMAGKLLWSCQLPKPQHMSCCKLVGAADGYVYVAVTGDSSLYRVDSALSRCELVLGDAKLSLPSSLVVTPEDLQVIVTKNELPNIEPTAMAASSKPVLPITTEIDIFIHNKEDQTT